VGDAKATLMLGGDHSCASLHLGAVERKVVLPAIKRLLEETTFEEQKKKLKRIWEEY